MATLGQRIKELRKNKGITQDEFANALNKIGAEISRSSLTMYENDKRRPTFETLECIADYFNVDMNYLLGKSQFITRVVTPSEPQSLAFKLAKYAEEEGLSEDDLKEVMALIKKWKDK